jgi:hypothetical protein
MQSLYLDKTNRTPQIILDPKQELFEIKGRSIPENSVAFYEPVISWIEEYRKEPNQNTRLVVRLEYFNTASSKCLIELLRKLETIHLGGHAVEMEWYYEKQDEDMRESGEDFKEILKIPIQMIALEENH